MSDDETMFGLTLTQRELDVLTRLVWAASQAKPRRSPKTIGNLLLKLEAAERNTATY